MKQEDPAIVLRKENERLQKEIHHHALVHGWHNVARVLRATVFVHVGWDADFTELDNVLRRIERVFKNEVKETKPDGSLHPPD